MLITNCKNCLNIFGFLFLAAFSLEIILYLGTSSILIHCLLQLVAENESFAIRLALYIGARDDAPIKSGIFIQWIVRLCSWNSRGVRSIFDASIYTVWSQLKKTTSSPFRSIVSSVGKVSWSPWHTRLPSQYAPVSSLARWLDMIKLAQYAGLIN